MVKKIIAKLFFILLLLVVFSLSVIACTCGEDPPLFIEYQRADSVFIGKVKYTKKLPDKLIEDSWSDTEVTFEIENIYKGLDNLQKMIVVNADVKTTSCGFGDELRPRKGQKWMVFVYRNPQNNSLNFGGSCDPSGKLENDADRLEYEKEFFSIKEKQGIVGKVFDVRQYESVKDVDVSLEGNGQKFAAKTSEAGLYHFLVKAGKYKLTVIINSPGYYEGGNFSVESISAKPITSENSRPNKNVFIYNLDLKESEFIYEELRFYFLPDQ